MIDPILHLSLYDLYIMTRLLDGCLYKEIGYDLRLTEGAIAHRVSKMNKFLGELHTTKGNTIALTPLGIELAHKAKAALEALK